MVVRGDGGGAYCCCFSCCLVVLVAGGAVAALWWAWPLAGSWKVTVLGLIGVINMISILLQAASYSCRD